MRARAAGEFVGQAADHPPLPGAGILRLIDQDMVDAAVQPPQHPLRHAGFLQQFGGAADQVVEIQPALRRLGRVHPRRKGMPEPVQRQRAFRRGQGQRLRAGQLHPLHQGVQIVHEGGAGAGAQILGRQGTDLGTERHLGGAAEQKTAEQAGQIVHARIAPADLRQRLGQLGIGGFARAQHRDQRIGQIGIGAGKDLRQQPVLGQARGHVQRRPDRRRVGGVRIIGQRQPGQEPVQIVAALQAGQIGDGGVGFLGHLLDDLGAHGPRAAVVQLCKAHRHPGLQRKAAQDGGAKAVDRLHLEAARRLDRAGEQAPRGGQVGIAPLAQLGQFGTQGGFGQHRPGAKPRQQAVLHLCRGGLGIGQAQDAFGRRPRQQQPRDTVGQHAGLARPRIGRQPGRAQRIGRRDLVQRRLIHDDRPPFAAPRHRSTPIRRTAPGDRNRPHRTCFGAHASR